MKRKKFICFTAIALLTFCMLIFGGCPEEQGENKVDPKLVGDWSNNDLDPDNERTFSIKANGSFTASLNPGGAQGRGMVNGVLIKEGNEYMMNKMTETTGQNWGPSVGLYNRVYVKITLSNNNNTFTLICEDVPIVEEFFGGTYHRK